MLTKKARRDMFPRCAQQVWSGPRAGDECGFHVSEVIVAPAVLELVCGYHARAYLPTARYPLWANLAQLRRLQMANLNAMESANEAVASFDAP